MNNRILPYLVLFIVGLGGAYWASVPKGKSSKGQLWLNLEGKIKEVQYIGDSVEVLVDIPNRWIEVNPTGDSTAKRQVFKAGKTLDDVLKGLEKIYAIKVIGSLKDIDSKEYGLENSKTRLDVVTEETKYSFDVGKRSFQTSNVFLHDSNRKEVILASRNAINLLRNAKARLYERSPIDFKLNDNVSLVKVRRGGDSIEIEKKGKDDKGKLLWKRKDKEQPSQDLGSWLNKVVKLQAKKYADPKHRQDFDKLSVILEASFFDREKSVDTIKIVKREKGKEKFEYWLTSSYVGSYVLLDGNRAKTLIQDFQNLIL